MSAEVSGVFVSHRGQFDDVRGGTQICTREYFDTLAAAGIELERLLIDVDQRLSTRILKRFNSLGYFRSTLPTQMVELVARIRELQPRFVFLNQNNLAHLAGPIRAVLPTGAKIIMLSHGLESTDLLHFLRLRDRLPLSGRARPTPKYVMGAATLYEARTRPDLDQVFVLSASDALLETWFGARKTTVVPRLVAADPLDWRPIGSRLGYVGTLDHAPNLEGFTAALDSLARHEARARVRVRVIGGPPKTGEWLARTYDTVDYLGPLPREALLKEAASWNAFLHPIFCVARGCSTKLAEPLGWGMPIVTTEQGYRGYAWQAGSLVTAETPDEFVDRSVDLLHLDKARQAQAEVVKVLRSSPSQGDVATLIRTALGLD